MRCIPPLLILLLLSGSLGAAPSATTFSNPQVQTTAPQARAEQAARPTPVQPPAEEPEQLLQHAFEAIASNWLISREAYAADCAFVSTYGRKAHFWPQVLSELRKNKGGRSEMACVRVLGGMLEMDAFERAGAPPEPAPGATNQPIRLDPEVVKELITRGERADGFMVDHYAIALARSRLAAVADFFDSVLQRKPGWHVASAQFHAAVGLAQLGDPQGVEWLIASLDDTSNMHGAVPDDVKDWNLNTSSLAALAILSGSKELKTKKEWENWWHQVESKPLGRHYIHLVDINN